MKRFWNFLGAGILGLTLAQADTNTNTGTNALTTSPAPASTNSAASTSTMAVVEAVMALDETTKPTDSFTPNAPQLNAFFQSAGTHKGDQLRGVWIATDVGAAAPPNTKINEATITSDKDDFHGAFTLTKPTRSWPAGQYRVELYLNGALVTTVKFTIDPNKSSDENP